MPDLPGLTFLVLLLLPSLLLFFLVGGRERYHQKRFTVEKKKGALLLCVPVPFILSRRSVETSGPFVGALACSPRVFFVFKNDVKMTGGGNGSSVDLDGGGSCGGGGGGGSGGSAASPESGSNRQLQTELMEVAPDALEVAKKSGEGGGGVVGDVAMSEAADEVREG